MSTSGPRPALSRGELQQVFAHIDGAISRCWKQERLLAVLPGASLACGTRSPEERTETAKLMTFSRILAVKLREIGDAVIWTSALQRLRACYPTARIDVLVRQHSEPVLRGQPWIDRVHTVPARTSFQLARKLISLRSQDYDLMLGFHATNTLCNLAPLAGAPNRVLHYHKSNRSQRFSTIAVPNPGDYEDAVSRDHRVLEALGFAADPPAPKLVLDAKERELARDRLLAACPQLGTAANKLLTLLPGGSRVTKRYPKDLWLSLLSRIAEARPAASVAVFVDEQLSLQWDLRKACAEKGVPLFDKLGLRELMGLLSWADVVISNDSGPKHIAVALGARTVTLFGPSEVGEWHPYDRAEHPVLRVTVPCRHLGPQDLEPFRYCTIAHCDHLSCLRRIDPDLVWSVARQLLAEPAPNKPPTTPAQTSPEPRAPSTQRSDDIQA